MKYKLIIILFFAFAIIGCEDQNVDFPDYDLHAIYFPIQLPLRTISLGEDRTDNSLDRKYQFDIGVSIGGMYENNKEWMVDYVVDPALTDSVYSITTPAYKIEPLPPAYYTLNPENSVTISPGSFNGLIRVQLADEFFEDSLAIMGHYAIPLRLTGTTADSILSGQSSLLEGEIPDRRIPEHWEASKSPKDWVLFGIKYVNAYHGNYLHRGRVIKMETASGIPVDTTFFGDKYRERDPLVMLTTTGKMEVITNGVGNRTGADYSMVLEFENDQGNSGEVTIKPAEGVPYSVTGSGQYFDKATSSEQWSLITWQSMYLNYSYDDGVYTHQISDTLVFRDRDIKYEELLIKIGLAD
jgi:hypothetical protein